MDILNVLGYGGIVVLVVLLIIFELKDGSFRTRTPLNSGYEYYTADNSCVRIRKVFGSLYKIYVYSECPVSTKSDRFGSYFTVKGRSAAEVESIVDDIYQRGSVN